MRRRISQREAKKLQKRVQELEHAFWLQRKTWACDYVGGIIIASVTALDASVRTRVAKQCGHAVVAVVRDNDQSIIDLHALPHYREDVTCPR